MKYTRGPKAQFPHRAPACPRFSGKLVSNSSGEVQMVLRVCAKVSAVRSLTGLLFLILACGLAVRGARAVQCAVVHHGPPSDADKAFLSADYKTAEDLYRAQLAAKPGDPELTEGLVHALLQQQKVSEAADAVKASLAVNPQAPALITLRGEVELREGEPWTALGSAGESLKLDPCNPRTQLLLSHLSSIDYYFTSARNLLTKAHELDPEDPEIRIFWIGILPLKQAIPELEAYLTAPRGDDADDVRYFHGWLDRMKYYSWAPSHPCDLVSDISSTETAFTQPGASKKSAAGFALAVQINGRDTQLAVKASSDAMFVTRELAERTGLKPLYPVDDYGAGSYDAFASSIRVGGLEFHDCLVHVMNRPSVDRGDGAIGMGTFRRFLVTLDFRAHKLMLSPLPRRPDENPTLKQRLSLGGEDDDPAANHDRYVAPEMKNYMHVYHRGFDMMIPVTLNSSSPGLFILSPLAGTSMLSLDAARRVTSLRGESRIRVSSGDGTTLKAYDTNPVSLCFAGHCERDTELIAVDLSSDSRRYGMEISGYLGMTSLKSAILQIDYRDGLVNFDYGPGHDSH